jgi:hypothetical protein
LAEGPDALRVNWCEVTVTDPEGKVLYLNAWITDWPITEHNVAALAASGRARWKIENENNNTLKTSPRTKRRPKVRHPPRPPPRRQDHGPVRTTR